MRVLTLVADYPSYGNEIPNTFVHKYLKALKKTGVDVYVLLLDFRSIRKKRSWGLSSYEYDGIKVYRYAFPCGPIPGLLERLMIASAGKLYQYALKVEQKPDVIHAHFGPMGCVAARIKKKYSIPYLVTEHSSSFMDTKQKRRREHKYFFKGYKEASRIIAVSKSLMHRIETKCNKKIEVIPNILGDEFRRISSAKEKEFIVVSVGSLCARKRFDLLIDAVAKANKTDPNVKLWIIGEGALKPKLEQQAVDLGINDKVHFLGKKLPVELCELFNIAHVFALPSDAETFGVVYIEANACGLPVIATDCGGPSDIVDGSNGVIIPKNDAEALAAQIIKIKGYYAKYDPEAISQNALARYGENAVVTEYMKIYEEIINEPN